MGRAQGGKAGSQAPAETRHLARPAWKQRACGVNGGEGLSAPDSLPPVLPGVGGVLPLLFRGAPSLRSGSGILDDLVPASPHSATLSAHWPPLEHRS